MEAVHINDDGYTSTPEFTDDPTTEVSEVSTPVTFSVDASPQLSEQPLPLETATVTPKKKKKKKPKKSAKSKEAAGPGVTRTRSQASEGESEDRPQVLCISRNKHWRYISSYHGPWLQLPIELLDSLFQLNVDPAMYPGSPASLYPLNNSPISPSARLRGLTNFEDHSPPESPRGVISSAAFSPTTGKPVPPPIDPGVMRSVTRIRRLIDEATDLAVRASSGLSAVELGSMRNASSYNGTTWAAAQTLGLNPIGVNGGGGRNTGMSANRVHRLRAIAVQKLAQAYKMDEIASSVMVMQGGSVFDDVAERVLKHDPSDPDAKYVHFFHEKIPSRQLAQSTPTTTLDELISAFPHLLEYYRTRGIVHSFREDFSLAIKDFTHALKEARTRRKNNKSHHSDSRSSKPKKRKGTSGGPVHTNGQAPSDGTAVPEGMVEGPDGDILPLHPSMQPDAPEPIETQLLFLRGAAYLQQAVHLIESAVIELEGVKKPTGFDGPDLRLCCLANSRYGGVEIGNPDGPLGSRNGDKLKAYHGVLAAKPFRDQIHSLLKKSIRDHEKFLSHFDGGETAAPVHDGDIAYQVEFAFTLSESIRPGNHNNPPPSNMPDLPPALTTYHPLLIESHFSVLICYLMLANFDQLLHQFARTAMLVDGVEGYPIFLPPRSMGQAEFIEVLERLATGWKNGCQPHSLSNNHRGKARLTAGAIELPRLITPSISTSSMTSTVSMLSAVSAVSPIPFAPPPSTSSASLLANAIAGMDLNSVPPSASGSSASWAPEGSTPAAPASAGYITGPSSSTGSPFIGATAEPYFGSSSSGGFLHPDASMTDSYAPSTSSAPLSRKSSSHALGSPVAPSPSRSPQPHESTPDKGKMVDGGEPESVRADARHALDCARILLAPVVKRQKQRAQMTVAEKAKGIKKQKSMPINIPLHGPRVEIILAWLGAVHLPELDGV
ncbi:hypothetical protein D9756_006190 [Leucocoprinus leucothites]|uniref:Uncharacterized protein n=1 Tax=Leucocoprinus leucothites TaxID=201217 RepID=A0A8H5FWS4_9AGAR|nr:hypothetical protein D9756_006190 [Leucoagaricus leucothites]